MTTAILQIPVPRSVYMGPGQAPTRPQPNPNMIPPNKALLYKGALSAKEIGCPSISFILYFLINQTPVAPTAMAVPIIPYMWKDLNKNISWILYQEIISDFTAMIPKSIPESKKRRFFISAY